LPKTRILTRKELLFQSFQNLSQPLPVQNPIVTVEQELTGKIEQINLPESICLAEKSARETIAKELEDLKVQVLFTTAQTEKDNMQIQELQENIKNLQNYAKDEQPGFQEMLQAANLISETYNLEHEENLHLQEETKMLEKTSLEEKSVITKICRKTEDLTQNVQNEDLIALLTAETQRDKQELRSLKAKLLKQQPRNLQKIDILFYKLNSLQPVLEHQNHNHLRQYEENIDSLKKTIVSSDSPIDKQEIVNQEQLEIIESLSSASENSKRLCEVTIIELLSKEITNLKTALAERTKVNQELQETIDTLKVASDNSKIDYEETIKSLKLTIRDLYLQ